MSPASNPAQAGTVRVMGADARASVVLSAGEATKLREVLVACSQMLTWAGQHGSLQLETVVAQAAEAAGLGRSPGVLLHDVNLAIDCLDFAPAARRPR